MTYRARWMRKHLLAYDGRLLREWRDCSVCGRLTTHYQLDGRWVCHRSVYEVMVAHRVIRPDEEVRSHI